MLILTRKANQSIIINDEIEIFVCSSKPSSVRLGIKAPKPIRVYRKELVERIKRKKHQ